MKCSASRALVALVLVSFVSTVRSNLSGFCVAVKKTAVCSANSVPVTFFFASYEKFESKMDIKPKGALLLTNPDGTVKSMPFNDQNTYPKSSQVYASSDVQGCSTENIRSWDGPPKTLSDVKSDLLKLFGKGGTCGKKTVSGQQRIEPTHELICFGSASPMSTSADPITKSSAPPLCQSSETQPVKSWFALNTKLDLRSGGSYTLASTQTPFWFRPYSTQPCQLQTKSVDFSRAMQAMQSAIGITPVNGCPPGQGKSSAATCSGSGPWVAPKCEKCGAGKYSAVTSVEMICTSCQNGAKLSASAGNTKCTQCPYGTYGSATDAANKQCKKCTSSVKNERQCTGAFCPDEYYDHDKNPFTPCKWCPPGSFGAVASAGTGAKCEKCPVGTYDGDAKSSSPCNDCGLTGGSKFASGGGITCEPCRKGTYDHDFPNAGYRYTPCKTCPIGSEGANGVNAGKCTACPAGKYDHDKDSSTACQACSGAGKDAPGGGYTCNNCVGGTYDHDKNPATSCTQCAAGSYSVGGQAPCKNCTGGEYDHDMDAATPCMKPCLIASELKKGAVIDTVKSIVEAQLNKTQTLYDEIHKLLQAKQSAGSGRRRLLQVNLPQEEHRAMGGSSRAWSDDVLSPEELALDEHALTVVDNAFANTPLTVDRERVSLMRSWNADGTVSVSVMH